MNLIKKIWGAEIVVFALSVVLGNFITFLCLISSFSGCKITRKPGLINRSHTEFSKPVILRGWRVNLNKPN